MSRNDSLKRSLQLRYPEITFQRHSDRKKGELVYSACAEVGDVASGLADMEEDNFSESSDSVSRLIAGLGHCSSYDTIVRVETSLVKAHFDEIQRDIPPRAFAAKKWTTLVYDNIDFSEKTLTGHGTTHFTNGIMVQSRPCVDTNDNPQRVQISKHVRKLSFDCDIEIAPLSNIKKKKCGPDELSESSDYLHY